MKWNEIGDLIMEMVKKNVWWWICPNMQGPAQREEEKKIDIVVATN